MAAVQIICSEQTKNAVDDLAASVGLTTSKFLCGRLERLVEKNRARVEKYRKLKNSPLIDEKDAVIENENS